MIISFEEKIVSRDKNVRAYTEPTSKNSGKSYHHVALVTENVCYSIFTQTFNFHKSLIYANKETFSFGRKSEACHGDIGNIISNERTPTQG